jgi:hypothetical protein
MLRLVREGCLMNEDAPVKCALKIEMITYWRFFLNLILIVS